MIHTQTDPIRLRLLEELTAGLRQEVAARQRPNNSRLTRGIVVTVGLIVGLTACMCEAMAR